MFLPEKTEPSPRVWPPGFPSPGFRPLDEEIYFLYRTVRGGSEYKFHSDNDWFIRVCEPMRRSILRTPDCAGS